MKTFNIYLCGVGGQGIGLLSEVLLRSGDYAEMKAKAVDTHGLAQRGGIVISHLRFGKAAHSPMVSARQADLAVALERHEALRAVDVALKERGTLIYYNTVLQPLGVRLGTDSEVSVDLIDAACKSRDITCHQVECSTIEDPRMQNIAVLAGINKHKLIPGINRDHILQALDDLMAGPVLEKNLKLFNSF